MAKPSAEQLFVRGCFKRCTRCWTKSTICGSDDPAEYGPRSKKWWYDNNNSPGLRYYNNFIQESMWHFLAGNYPPWCRSGALTLGNSFITRQAYPDDEVVGTNTIHCGYYEKPEGQDPKKARGYFSIDISPIQDDDLYNSTGILIVFYGWMGYYYPSGDDPLKIRCGFYKGAYEQPYFRYTWNNQPPTGAFLGDIWITNVGPADPYIFINSFHYKLYRQLGLSWFNIIMADIQGIPDEMFIGGTFAGPNYPGVIWDPKVYLIF